MKEYIEEFYKMDIRAGSVKYFPERVVRYINGLRFEIQDEMKLLCPSSIEEAYQFSLKDEEKLASQSQVKSWGAF